MGYTAFELCVGTAREPGSEEYLDSEKYELRHWDLDRPESLKDLIARINRIRRANPALQTNEGLTFHDVDNAQILCYSKVTDGNTILVVVNVDPQYSQSGWVNLDLQRLGLDPEQGFQVHDLLSDSRYMWSGSRNFVQLDPRQIAGHIFAIQQRVRTENDFDYFA